MSGGDTVKNEEAFQKDKYRKTTDHSNLSTTGQGEYSIPSK